MAGFAGALLTQVRVDRAEEELRHARKMADLATRQAALEEAGTRSRRQIYLDPDASDDLVKLAISTRERLSAAEISGLLTRPCDKYLLRVVTDQMRVAAEDQNREQDDRTEIRLLKILDALVDVDVWPVAIRVKLMLEPWCRDIVTHLAARADAEPAVALMLGMHSTGRTWGRNISPQMTTLTTSGADNPWFQIGRAMNAGQMSAEHETPIRARLLALAPLKVATTIATSMPMRREKGAIALAERVGELENLVAGVLAEPATA